ncbi:SUKH-3 domain-containing protein [Mesorhizobium sp.]|uniref:SUKH-3 domain-containing protein n=1 Tax=Mesorhizobium sp. TaxID=1871066 RepID=UPI002579A19B|nr:SUKH-3 domain-containing protein [Mesorhizobium sp.]
MPQPDGLAGARCPYLQRSRLIIRRLAILSEFGGLNVGKLGPGMECAGSDVIFCWSPHEGYREILDIGDMLHMELACFATAHNRHESLYVDREGWVFVVFPDMPGIGFTAALLAKQWSALCWAESVNPEH